MGNNGSDKQKYIVYFCVEEFYSPAVKILHLQINEVNKNTVSSKYLNMSYKRSSIAII